MIFRVYCLPCSGPHRRPWFTRLFPVVLFSLLLFQPGYVWAQRGRAVELFSVGRQRTIAEEFIYMYEKNHRTQPAAFTPEKIEEYLQLYIHFKLKVADARARGLDTTRKFQQEFRTYRDDLRKPYLSAPDALEEAAREAYQRLQEEVKASHILLRLDEQATPADTLAAWNRCQQIRSRIVAGADFHQVAAELSEDPSARQNRGELGFFTALQMVLPFEEAAYRLQPGELSQPVRTQFGYHLIRLEQRQPAKGEVEVSHILFRSQGPDDRQAQQRMQVAEEQLRKGRPWEEVCKEFSDDLSTREAGGRLRPFGVGALASVPEFEMAAFALREPGQVSDPFSSALGWHIVRLEKRIPVPPYEELAPSLKRRLARDERLQIAKERWRQQRKHQFGVTEYPAVVARVQALADTSLTQGRWKRPATVPRETVVVVDRIAYSTLDLLRFMEQRQSPVSQSVNSCFQQLYRDFVEELLLSAEDARLIATQPEYRHLLQEYREGILLFEVMEQEVWGKANADSSGLRRYFEANQSRYPAGERVEARLYLSVTPGFLEGIKRRLEKGDSLTQEDRSRIRTFVPVRKYEAGDNQWVDRAGRAPGVYVVTDEGAGHLVEVLRVVPAELKSLDEARVQVLTDYQDVLEKAWLARLRNTYPVKISAKGKRYVISRLTSK